MQMWLLRLPHLAEVFLAELKNLALLEFIPYEWLSGGGNNETTSGEDSTALNGETGIERFGSNTLVSGLGSMLVLAIGMGGIILVLLCLKML